jgi:hypothetical protein
LLCAREIFQEIKESSKKWRCFRDSCGLCRATQPLCADDASSAADSWPGSQVRLAPQPKIPAIRLKRNGEVRPFYRGRQQALQMPCRQLQHNLPTINDIWSIGIFSFVYAQNGAQTQGVYAA